MKPLARTTLAPPRGFRDILPTEARELRAIERALTEAFTAYGFMPLEPPMVEHGAEGPKLAGDDLIQFFDRDGSLLALRPDITTAVARVVAERYADTVGDLRLQYFGPVFREQPAMLGAEREYDQAGVELIGPSGPLADAEALALLADALARAGLRGGTIEVGHAGVVAGLFADLDEVTRESVLGDLRLGDQVGAFRRAHDAGMTERAITQARRALAARGRDAEALDIPGVSELREVLDLARHMFAGDWGVPNLGLVPALPYYTGIVFEALHPAVGFPIAAGGRYDVLLAAFGAARAATGFAINVQRLHLALFDSGWRPSVQQALIALLPGDAATTARLAARLRGVGLTVAIGSVAEPAGNTVVSASVVDAERVRLGDGRTLTADELVRSLL